MNVNFNPFPDLESERLLFRRLDQRDLNGVFALRSNPQIMKYIPRPILKNLDEAQEHINMINEKIDQNTGINWAITFKENPDILLGIIGLYKIYPENFRAEIGYMLLPEFNFRGIMTESVFKITSFGFNEMHLHSIEAIIDPENVGSEKTLLKCGYKKEAHFKESAYFDGKFINAVHFGILNKS